MGKLNSTIGIVLIVIGVLFLLALLLFFVNYYTAKCDNADLLDKENNMCYTESTVACTLNQTAIVKDGKIYCEYKPKSFLSTGVVKGLSIFLAILFIIILFIVISMLNMDDEGKVKKLTADQVVNLFCQWLSNKYNIPIIDGKFKQDSFKIYSKFTKHTGTGEDIIRCQIEMLDGDKPGVYTFDVSLNNTEADILAGAADFEQSAMCSYKRPRDFPIFVPTNISERLLSRMQDIDPEKAQMLEEQIVERQLRSGNVDKAEITPETITHQQNQQPTMYQPRRPMFRRRYTNYGNTRMY